MSSILAKHRCHVCKCVVQDLEALDALEFEHLRKTQQSNPGHGASDGHTRGSAQFSQPARQGQAQGGQQAQHAQQEWHDFNHSATAPDPCQRNAFDYGSGGVRLCTQSKPPSPSATRDPLALLHPPNGNTVRGRSEVTRGNRIEGGMNSKASSVQSSWIKASSQALVRPLVLGKQGQRTLLQSWGSQGPATQQQQQQHFHNGQSMEPQLTQQQQQQQHRNGGLYTQQQIPQQQQQQQRQQVIHTHGAQHIQPSTTYSATPAHHSLVAASSQFTEPARWGDRRFPEASTATAHPTVDINVDLASDGGVRGTAMPMMPAGHGATVGAPVLAHASMGDSHVNTAEASLVDVATTTGDIKLHRRVHIHPNPHFIP